MKKQFLKGFVCGLIVMLLLTSLAFGGGINKSIEAIFNNVNIAVNGEKVEVDNILYNGTTYAPLRAVAEMLGKEVAWDGKTNTASINDRKYKVVTVQRVVDGDTIEIKLDGNTEKVRLTGVDTPESVHPDASKNIEFGKVASEFTKQQLEGKEVELEFDVQERDKYGRLLAYVYIEGKMFNKTLLEEGYAKVATFPPNVKYVSDFTELERIARSQKKGLWGLEDQTETQDNNQTQDKSVVTGNQLKVKAGEEATVTIEGTPNVEYKISVYYSSGPSKASGLEPKKADSNGKVSWTWKVGSKTSPGIYKIVITGDKTIEIELEVAN